jgi:hypothetical protein
MVSVLCPKPKHLIRPAFLYQKMHHEPSRLHKRICGLKALEKIEISSSQNIVERILVSDYMASIIAKRVTTYGRDIMMSDKQTIVYC